VTRWTAWVRTQLDEIRSSGQWRAPRTFDARGATGTLDDREVVSFASNDYLGLTAHPDVVAAAHRALDRWGAGSGAARLIVGSRPPHDELEAALADWKATEAAVVFPTGFAANLGVLSTFAGPGTLVLSDELNHASIIDGCRLARAEIAVYPHGDVDHVRKALRAHEGRALVVTDTIFSMDGDAAPVDDLAALCSAHDALLVVDEAHAVLGPDPVFDGVDVVRVGTLSKTLGSLGGFVATSTPFAELLVNRARPYVFTTASPPSVMAAASAALRVLRSAEGDDLRARLRSNIDRLRPGHPSPIVPIVLGDERVAVAAAGALLEHGLLVPAIRPPTVAPGTCRLRVALSAAHTPAQLDALVEGLDRCVPSWRD
jgi:8-amino-7-oxononanoate synthase